MADGRNAAILDRCRESVAGGDSSTMRVLPYHPAIVAVAGDGARYTDADGHDVLDMNMGYGPLLFGHRPDFLVRRLVDQIENRGTHLGFPTELNADVAEKIKRLFPSIELLRFANSGTEAIASAVRLARAYTGKPGLILFEGHYHGWSEAVFHRYHAPLDALPTVPGEPAPAGTAGMMGGAIVPDSHLLPWNDLDAVERFVARNAGRIGAAIMEPVMGNAGVIPPEPGFLAGVREILHRHGVLLIFDEVITGFRVAGGGAQDRYGVPADITVVSKALGGGVPIAAFGARAEIMQLIVDRRVFHGGVYSSNTLVLSAADAVLDRILADRDGLYAELERKGARLAATLRDALGASGQPHVVQHVGPMVSVFLTRGRVDAPRSYREVATHGDFDAYVALQRRLLQAGVYVHPNMYEPIFLSLAHTDADIAAFGEALARMREPADA